MTRVWSHNRSGSVFRARVSGFAFVVLCLLVAFGMTHPMDWWFLTVVTSFSSSPLELTGDLLTLLGDASLTGAITVALAYYWGRQRKAAVVAPLLLFVGVGIEIRWCSKCGDTPLPKPASPYFN